MIETSVYIILFLCVIVLSLVGMSLALILKTEYEKYQIKKELRAKIRNNDLDFMTKKSKNKKEEDE